MESVMLSNGVKMPVLGYGVYQVAAEECERCVLDALKVGYRSLDTAQSYFNEAQVGSAMRKSDVPREEIFLTTKVWVEHYGYDDTNDMRKNSGNQGGKSDRGEHQMQLGQPQESPVYPIPRRGVGRPRPR